MKTRLAILSICLAAFCLKSTELWRFLPNYQVDVRGIQHAIQHGSDIFETLPVPAETLLSANSPLTESQRNELHWHPARFPHRDFVSMMPQRNVFGWYGCLFDIPQALQDMDVLADLGIVDDTDETYVNGVRIGGTGEIGKPHGTAWQTDRLYRIPAEGLTPYVNYLEDSISFTKTLDADPVNFNPDTQIAKAVVYICATEEDYLISYYSDENNNGLSDGEASATVTVRKDIAPTFTMKIVNREELFQ